MNHSFVRQVLRNNWHLLLILAVCIVATLLFYSPAGDEADSPAARDADPAQAQPSPPITPTRARLTPAEEAEQTIAAHRAELEVDPKGEGAPALLLSIGNLYAQKLQDYDQAISAYERLLADFPEWESIRKVFTQLASAYEKNGQTDKAQSVYREMLRRFPPGTVEHEYAATQLQQAAPN